MIVEIGCAEARTADTWRAGQDVDTDTRIVREHRHAVRLKVGKSLGGGVRLEGVTKFWDVECGQTQIAGEDQVDVTTGEDAAEFDRLMRVIGGEQHTHG